VSARGRLALAAALAVGAGALYLYRVDRPFGNSDEAIYAQTAREMAQDGDLLTLHWQGRPVLSRPPLSVWPLAAAVRLWGPRDLALRAVVALEAAAGVALLFLLGARRGGTAVGLIAALLLATSDRYYVYARYIESEPLLCALVIAAFLCWQRGSMVGWGLCLGAALLTKQIVGALPLLAPFLDPNRVPWRALARGLAAAAALIVPYAIVQCVRYGVVFPRVLLGANVMARSMAPMHQSSGPAFYFQMLWRREGPLVLVAALGLGFSLAKRDFLPAAWTLATLLPFSIAASRYDYYALLFYPALALAAARLLCALVRGYLALPVVALWAALHLLPHWPGPPPPEDPETGLLAQKMAQLSRPDDPLVMIDQLPYSARYYSQRRTVQVVLDAAEYRETSLLLPAEVVLAPDPVPYLQKLARWFAIVPHVDGGKLRGLGPVVVVGATPTYRLITNLSAR